MEELAKETLDTNLEFPLKQYTSWTVLSKGPNSSIFFIHLTKAFR